MLMCDLCVMSFSGTQIYNHFSYLKKLTELYVSIILTALHVLVFTKTHWGKNYSHFHSIVGKTGAEMYVTFTFP